MLKWVKGIIPALLMHISIGSVYAFSLFYTPLKEYFGTNDFSIQSIFSLAIFFLGMSAAFCGNLVEKDIHKSGKIGSICFISGFMISALACQTKQLWLMHLGYGIIGGCGLGLIYLTPCKTIMMWFPNNKGLALGISVMGFGLGSTLASPLINNFIRFCSLTETFLLLGCIYAFLLLIGTSLLEKPKNFLEKTLIKENSFKYKKIIFNPIFISLWIIFFCNIHCGLATISYATEILSVYNTKQIIIPIVISVMGIFNGLGRILFSTLSDKLENRGFIFVTIATIPLLLMIPLESFGAIGICILLCLIAMIYGAGFACIAPLLSEIFGMKNISKIHGLILSAWGIAGLTGNLSMVFFKNIGLKIPQIFWIIFVLYICEFILSSIITLTLKEKNGIIK